MNTTTTTTEAADTAKTAEQRLIENVAEAKRAAAEQAQGFVTYSGATVHVGDVVTGIRYGGVRRFTITITGISAGPGMVHGLIHGAKGGAHEGDYTGTTSLDIATVEPIDADPVAVLEAALDAAPLGSLLVQDTTDHGVQIVAVLVDEQTAACPWLRANGVSRANGGALAHLSSAMPRLRVVNVDVEAGR